METLRFEIPAHRVGALTAELDRLNKRGAKNGLDPIMYQVGEEFLKDGTLYNPVLIDGSVPRIDGWEFAASMEYLPEGGEVAKTVGFHEVPAKYRGVERPYCEHCNSHRIKKYSVVLYNEDEDEYMNVGKTCLTDYLGPDAEAVAARFKSLTELVARIEVMDEEFFGSAGAIPGDSMDYVLAVSAMVVREKGYVKSGEDGATKLIVSHIIHGLWNDRPRPYPTDDDFKVAAAAREWMLNHTGTSDYILNCKNLLGRDYALSKHYGFLVSIIPVYLREVEKESREKMVKLDEHFGEVKKRYTMELTLLGLTVIETDFGDKFIHRFRDSEGRNIVWFSTAGRLSKRTMIEETDTDTGETYSYEATVRIEEGDTWKVKATVKTHGDYRGEKQTTVTRVTAVK